MRILDRLALLLRADAHGVMDRLEERSLLLKQHLRDAELELQRKRTRVYALEEEERALREEVERLEVEILGLDEDVDRALVGEKDELARFAVRRLLPQKEVRDELHRRADYVAGVLSQLRERLELQEAEFEDLKRRVRARLDLIGSEAEQRHESRSFRVSVDGPSVAEEEVELELLRRSEANMAQERSA